MINLLDIRSFFFNLENIIGNKHTIFAVATLSFFIKLYLIKKLFSYTFKHKKTYTALSLLIIFIATSMITDTGWIIKFTRELLIPSMDYRYTLFWIRITWVFNVIQFHSLALFIESLIKNKKLFGLRQKICIPITLTMSSLFFIVAITRFNNVTPPNHSTFLKIIFHMQLFYNLYVLLLLSTIITSIQLIKANLPKILKKQLKIFLFILIGPFLATELIHFYPFNIFQNFMNNKFALPTLSLALVTIAIYYSIKKVIGLRFLHMQEKQPFKRKYNFIQDFQLVLEQFSQATSEKELQHITQNFFKTAFCIPTQKTKLYIRKLYNQKEYKKTKNPLESKVETFIAAHFHGCCLEEIIRKEKILVKDDIEFNNYYEEAGPLKKIIRFLINIDTSIFIPIYEKNNLIAYIIIENHISGLYNNKEIIQMVIFASYLGNVIHLLQNRNLKTLIKNEKELQEELYSKHQEIHLYKESIRSLLNKNEDKKNYPEISDWDYLLHLETTQSGKLINELIPGHGKTLLNFKIELLKTALSKKALLLNLPREDLLPTVEILHHISFKEQLHVLNLQKRSKNPEIAIQLFGINPIFQIDKHPTPLLEKLDGTGTLFIKNIHYLNMETQNYLAEFIRYGFYRPFKGHQTISSNVRIICSTNINLKKAVQDGTFSRQLFHELQKTSICKPPTSESY